VTINGRATSHHVPPRMILAEFLRDQLGLTGTKISCEIQVCGACTVLVDGKPISSCTYLAADIDGREVMTIEGVAEGDSLHPIQQAFVDHNALQCGFCTPGFVMATLALLAENQNPTEDDVAHYLEGNICRCTGYRPIIKAVIDAADRMGTS
ncbi:MAG: (2Fe-2S)-binding protein, partial [Acidimicrobiia bacterium]|nr:(2Fe-2S)-binding protein [Acidimicrobiia bacterium]